MDIWVIIHTQEKMLRLNMAVVMALDHHKEWNRFAQIPQCGHQDQGSIIVP